MRAVVTGGIGGVVDTFGKSLKYATCFGRFWYLTIMFRVMMVYTIGTSLYSNDESTFNCATKQFLCETVCFNQFMPINLNRYWQWQTLRSGKSVELDCVLEKRPHYKHRISLETLLDFIHFTVWEFSQCCLFGLLTEKRKK